MSMFIKGLSYSYYTTSYDNLIRKSRSDAKNLLRIGEVLHLSNNRNLIVKMDGANPPSLGSRIFNDQLKFIGAINDIFGSTSSPYISIKPFIESPLDIVGTTVYSNDVKRR